MSRLTEYREALFDEEPFDPDEWIDNPGGDDGGATSTEFAGLSKAQVIAAYRAGRITQAQLTTELGARGYTPAAIQEVIAANPLDEGVTAEQTGATNQIQPPGTPIDINADTRFQIPPDTSVAGAVNGVEAGSWDAQTAYFYLLQGGLSEQQARNAFASRGIEAPPIPPEVTTPASPYELDRFGEPVLDRFGIPVPAAPTTPAPTSPGAGAGGGQPAAPVPDLTPEQVIQAWADERGVRLFGLGSGQPFYEDERKRRIPLGIDSQGNVITGQPQYGSATEQSPETIAAYRERLSHDPGLSEVFDTTLAGGQSAVNAAATAEAFRRTRGELGTSGAATTTPGRPVEDRIASLLQLHPDWTPEDALMQIEIMDRYQELREEYVNPRGLSSQQFTIEQDLGGGYQYNPDTGGYTSTASTVRNENGDFVRQELSGQAQFRANEASTPQDFRPYDTDSASYILSLLRQRGTNRLPGFAGGGDFTVESPHFVMDEYGRIKAVIGEGVDARGKPIPESVDVTPREQPNAVSMEIPGVMGLATGDPYSGYRLGGGPAPKTNSTYGQPSPYANEIRAAQTQASRERAIQQELINQGLIEGPDTGADQGFIQNFLGQRQSAQETAIDREALLKRQEALAEEAGDLEALTEARMELAKLRQEEADARLAEQGVLDEARGDVQNQVDVARGRARDAVYDAKRSAFGLQPVQELLRPIGMEGDVNLPPGVRFAPETDTEILQRQYAQARERRAAEMEAQKAVIDARIIELEAQRQSRGLSLQQAENYRNLRLLQAETQFMGPLFSAFMGDFSGINNQQYSGAHG